jgi:hypothetical protein
VRRKNAVLQDDSYRATLLNRIDALDPSLSIVQDVTNAYVPTAGMMEKDPTNRTIRFDPVGFTVGPSAFREGTINNPVKLWLKSTDSGSVRYLLADRDGGVLLLNSSLEILNRFANFGTITTPGVTEYNDPSGVCTFTIGATEYVAITLYSHHICQIYEYAAPFNHVATIGTLDTPGSTSAFCYNPVAVAVDETNEVLFILNENGTPPGATLDRGYIARYDISTPSAPVHLDSPWYYKNNGSLLDNEIDTAADIFYDAGVGLLWVTNGNNQVGGFALSPAISLSRLIEPSGSGYTLRHPTQVFVQEQLGGYRRIYVGNGETGTVEEFDYLHMTHLKTYGYRASEDELNSFNRLSDSVYGAVGFPSAVTADEVTLDGITFNALVVADNLNRRLTRFNIDSYDASNFVNFDLVELTVPVSLYGWSLSGTVPPDMVTVYYRFDETEEFRVLPQETNTPPSSTFQFRVAVQLDSQRFVREWRIDYLRIHATQV